VEFRRREGFHLGIGCHARLLSTAAELAAHQVPRVKRRYSLEHLHFFIADGFAVGADRGFHGKIGEHLEQMILDDIADSANPLIEGASSLHAKVLLHSDLHAFDMSTVPKRLRQFIGEPEKQHAVNRLFAEVMVDSVNRLFVERLKQDLVVGTRRAEIATERLFNDDARIARAIGL
jgi:hypothetical protein